MYASMKGGWPAMWKLFGRGIVRARAKGLGLGRLASKADLLDLPSTLSVVAGDSGGRLRCLLELRISLDRCATFTTGWSQ